ncbi:chemokine-like protein TAFA-5 [Oryzias melastigma]|uniref:chemokine-like protein TAFA-5 n=1 Tax=Oryzias melastigma TaxID=30732 RepID=UPI000CF7B756|nr:chemokine-like protein TAFA-5 [Oryzias melastigma]
MQLLPLISALSAAALLSLLRLHQKIHWEGQAKAGTCEVVTLDEDRSQPWRTVNRQSVRCACRKGQMAGTIRARPACVDEGVVRTQRWCEMSPCLKDEACHLLDQRSGWICSQPGGRVKTTTVS